MLTKTLVAVCGVLLQQHYAAGQNCPERNGRFPVGGQCDAYIECEGGVATEKMCPDGLLFNDKLGIFSYPCQYPKDVDCQGRSALQPADPTEDCPHQFGYYRLGDQNNCGQFMNCAAGRGYTFDCPTGLAYNEVTYQCDWPDQVPTCDAEAFLGFRCPDDSRDGFFSDEYKFYRSPADCQKYFICINGKPRLYQCGNGYAFNEDIGGCDGIENVTSCNIPNARSAQPIQLTPRGRG